jgi:hypothetical protein
MRMYPRPEYIPARTENVETRGRETEYMFSYTEHEEYVVLIGYAESRIK